MPFVQIEQQLWLVWFGPFSVIIRRNKAFPSRSKLLRVVLCISYFCISVKSCGTHRDEIFLKLRRSFRKWRILICIDSVPQFWLGIEWHRSQSSNAARAYIYSLTLGRPARRVSVTYWCPSLKAFTACHCSNNFNKRIS